MNAIFTAVKYLLLAFGAGWLLTFLLLSRLPPQSAIGQPLYAEPAQAAMDPKTYMAEYKGQKITLIPVGEYLIRGLVVSHNDPGKWYRFDMTHDEKSVDARDLCIIWGTNLNSGSYHKIHFYNDDRICGYDYAEGVTGSFEEQMSNNRLVTVDEAMRKRILGIDKGDQIEIRGRLVNYSEERWSGRLKHSSVTRNDHGETATEIIYVDSLLVLNSHNRLWRQVHDLCGTGFLIVLGLLVMLFIFLPRRYLR